MKIKDLIVHLQTLEQDRELILLLSDYVGRDSSKMIDEHTIKSENLFMCKANGLQSLIVKEKNKDSGKLKCYVVRMEV